MLAECEDGLVALVKDSELGQRLALVAGLPEIDGPDLVNKFSTEAPAVYVAPGQITTSDGSMFVSFSIGCVAKSARGQEAARKGDGMAIGLYQIVEGVAALVDRATAGDINWSVTGINYLTDPLLSKAGLHVAVVMARSSGAIEIPAALDEAALSAFETFRADYDIEPFATAAEHAKWASDPPNYATTAPEVSETVTLQPQE